ncbi:MAG TPA: nucleotidyltransferase domain-containing protein [Solirubrobacteraceae bacterium]|nr:nucleotidyltransferase domain-containing protein [Solirubrobacteraceae bacterium]
MSAKLQEMASSLNVNERTLRRAWALGTLRGTRVTPYRLELPLEERMYLRGHWQTLSRLRSALRTERNVSMAVVFGSVARGDDDDASDLDLLVALRDPGLPPQVALTKRLRGRTGLDVEVVALEDAWRRPSLMLEILRDGRVLVDRDERWPDLRAQSERIRARTRRDRQLRRRRARQATAVFAKKAGASR